jgi:transposase
VLVELRLVEQCYKAVLEGLEGAQVTDVSRRYGVARQTVHDWLHRYGDHGLAGLAGLADRSSRPSRCPHQMAPEVEAQVVAVRLAHPGWRPATIGYELAKAGTCPVPGRTSIYRALVRHDLVEGKKRKRRRADYRRFERPRAMELWQMDVVGGFHLIDRTELKSGHWPGRPQRLLRLCSPGAANHFAPHLPGVERGYGQARGAQGRHDRQRQDLHLPLWPRPGAGPI